MRHAFVAFLLFVACSPAEVEVDSPLEESTTESFASARFELDSVYAPKNGVALLELSANADWQRVTDAIERTGGVVHRTLPPRLIIAEPGAGSDAVLAALGVSATFTQATDASALSNATLDEARFLRIFSNRYYPDGVPPPGKVKLMHEALPAGANFEAGAKIAPEDPFANLDRSLIPYASGTIVVALILPQSNGVAEPSTERWTEDEIVAARTKVETALEAFVRTEPNAKLNFVVHYESQPANGGLEGTVDSDYEVSHHANYDNWAGEAMIAAPILSKLTGQNITTDHVFEGYWTYLNQVRAQYNADAAFAVMVAANQQFTGGLRPHAYINGPHTTLDSGASWEVFMHEFGHIFGAIDEYCPDQCQSTTVQQGYLGMTNANATLRAGGDGINAGQGEDTPSLMAYNVVNAVNGYSRGAWGWLDLDGDGLFEVRDTFAETRLSALAAGGNVRVSGTVEDLGFAREENAPRRSVNQVTALDYRVGTRPWIRLPFAAARFGASEVTLDLGRFPAGSHALEFRALNSVGNVGPVQRFTVNVSGSSGNLPPRASLSAPAVARVGEAIQLEASAFDFNTTSLTYVWNGATSTSNTRTITPSQAGVLNVQVTVRDPQGLSTTASKQILVLDAKAPRALQIGTLPSLVQGMIDPLVTAPLAENDRSYAWRVELATEDGNYLVESPFSPDNDTFVTPLPTPPSLAVQAIDLSGGDPDLLRASWLRHLLPLGNNLVAVAAGALGLWIVDVSTPLAAVVVSRLDLQTDATSLARDGDTLYVLGTGMLTVVDITNVRAPQEIKQFITQTRARNDENKTETPIDDGSEKGTSHEHWFAYGERVSNARIDIVVRHSRPRELRFELELPPELGGQRILLGENLSVAGGKRTFTFTPANTKALKPLVGLLASGNFILRVADTVAGNGSGSILSSKMKLDTRTRAFPVVTATQRLAGVYKNRYIVSIGDGVELIDARVPRLMNRADYLKRNAFFAATVVGDRVIALAADSTSKNGSTPPTKVGPKGLLALSLTQPTNVKQVRADESYTNGSDLSLVDDVLAVTFAGEQGAASTTVIDPKHFANNQSAWVLGNLPEPVVTIAGTKTRAFAMNQLGKVTQVNLTQRTIVQTFERPQNGGVLITLDADHALQFNGSPFAVHFPFDRTLHTTSRVYRLTAVTEDGAQTSRAVHVVPYNHAPAFSHLALNGAAYVGQEARIDLTLVDADDGTSWDPHRLVRFDWNGDGFYDSPWIRAGSKFGVPHVFDTAGHFNVRVQARDAFYATSEATFSVHVQP